MTHQSLWINHKDCSKGGGRIGNEGLPEVTNHIGGFRTMTSKIAARETESTVETEEQRQVRREQACVNLERQNAERREDRLEQ